MICARTNCTNEATMIHARRKRKDGSWYVVRWCNDCQRRRINAYNQTMGGYEARKQRQYIKRLSEKYA